MAMEKIQDGDSIHQETWLIFPIPVGLPDLVTDTASMHLGPPFCLPRADRPTRPPWRQSDMIWCPLGYSMGPMNEVELLAGAGTNRAGWSGITYRITVKKHGYLQHFNWNHEEMLGDLWKIKVYLYMFLHYFSDPKFRGFAIPLLSFQVYRVSHLRWHLKPLIERWIILIESRLLLLIVSCF